MVLKYGVLGVIFVEVLFVVGPSSPLGNSEEGNIRNLQISQSSQQHTL